MKKKPKWEQKNSIEAHYASSLKSIAKKMESLIKGKKDPQDIVDELNKFANSKALSMESSKAATKMATAVYEGLFNTWRQAATVSTRGRTIYEELLKETKKGHMVGNTYRDIIDNNAAIIKTLPYNAAVKASRKASKMAIEGKRASDIAKEIQKDFPEHTKASAKLIARTEVSKAGTALNYARSKSLGIKWYVWKTSKDARVRSSHAHMDNVLIRWDTPPAPEALNKQKSSGNYHAGNIYNCRCYSEPVVDIDLLKFPMKVYYNGKIQMMSKAAFKKIDNPVVGKKQTLAQKIAQQKAEAKVLKEAEEHLQQLNPVLAKEKAKAKKQAEKDMIKNIAKSAGASIKSLGDRVHNTYVNMDTTSIETSVNKTFKYFFGEGDWSNRRDRMLASPLSHKKTELSDFIAYTGSSYSWMNDTYRNDRRDKVTGERKERLERMERTFKTAPSAIFKPTKMYRATGLSFVQNAGFTSKERYEVEENLEDLGDMFRSFYNDAPGREKDLKQAMAEEAMKDYENELKARLVGNEAVEKSFTSTSYKDGAFGSSHRVRMEIDIDPRDTNALILASEGLSRYDDDEAEVLIEPGMRYVITDIKVYYERGRVKIRPTCTTISKQ